MPRSPSQDDSSDFAALVEPMHADCLRYAERMLGERADAEDAVQDAWLRGFRAFSRYDTSRPFRPWMFRILVNSVRSHLHQRNNWWRRWSADVDMDTLSADVADQWPKERFGAREALRGAVAALPNGLREAFLLKYVSEMSYQEMALATGATVPALKMRVKRACDVLRPQLQEVLENDDAD